MLQRQNSSHLFVRENHFLLSFPSSLQLSGSLCACPGRGNALGTLSSYATQYGGDRHMCLESTWHVASPNWGVLKAPNAQFPDLVQKKSVKQLTYFQYWLQVNTILFWTYWVQWKILNFTCFLSFLKVASRNFKIRYRAHRYFHWTTLLWI